MTSGGMNTDCYHELANPKTTTNRWRREVAITNHELANPKTTMNHESVAQSCFKDRRRRQANLLHEPTAAANKSTTWTCGGGEQISYTDLRRRRADEPSRSTRGDGRRSNTWGSGGRRSFTNRRWTKCFEDQTAKNWLLEPAASGLR